MELLTYLAALLLIAMIAVAAWTVCFARRPARTALSAKDAYEVNERSRMPEEIKRATLVISEKTLFRRGRRPFAAKTDQVFKTSDGRVVPVETKTRRRVSPTDIVQLTCQALALAQIWRFRGKVTSYGYVRLAPSGAKPYYQRVDLLHFSRIDQLWDRYKLLKKGSAMPIARPDPKRCSKCQFSASCPSRAV